MHKKTDTEVKSSSQMYSEERIVMANQKCFELNLVTIRLHFPIGSADLQLHVEYVIASDL